MDTITHVDVRMYTAGTGDCFVLKFFNSDSSQEFCMMIDGGTINRSFDHPIPYVKDIKTYVNNKLDVLVITHEHMDHVHFFNACEDLFLADDFEIDEVWMAWTENDEDDKVKKWKSDFGQKKRTLALAADRIEKLFEKDKFQEQFSNNEQEYGEDAYKYEHYKKDDIIDNFKYLSKTLITFKDLHFSVDDKKEYIGGQRGMEVVKKVLKKNRIRYFKAGEVIKLPKLPGIKTYVLGPPESYDFVKKTKGKKGSSEAYNLNMGLGRSNSFSDTICDQDSQRKKSPFSSHYAVSDSKIKDYYKTRQRWRSIDYDWLMMSAGQLALRVKRGLNNLSLVLAFEFEESGRVLLFPGDAEIGSWESWHTIDWKDYQNAGERHLTEDLLRRTVFYKTAHHNSKFGTAKEKGLELMTSQDLVIMTTLDYEHILSGWKSTMPNEEMLRVMLKKTKGRLIMMNEDKLFIDRDKKVPLSKTIEEERNRMTIREQQTFSNNYSEEPSLYKQYRVKG